MSHSFSSDRYKLMHYRRCGKSGLRLPAISLGFWHNFGATADASHARNMVLKAFDLGITHMDLANCYGPPPGSAETTFGNILHNELAAHRDELIISTKAGYTMWPGPYGDWGSRKYLLASLDQSLHRMRVDYVDIFYSHRPDPETPLEETVGALIQAVRQGKTLYAGISNYGPEATTRAAELLKEAGVPLLIHQERYHLFARTPESHLFPALKQVGAGCIAFCPLAQGLLTDRYLQGIPKDSRIASESPFLQESQLTPEVLEKIRALHQIASRRGQSLAQMALAWVLRRKEITSALIGASRPSQIEENVAALANLEFSPEEIASIETIASP